MRRKNPEQKNPKNLYHKLFYTYSMVLVVVIVLLVSYFIFQIRNRALETNRDYAQKLFDSAVSQVKSYEAQAAFLHQTLYQGDAEVDDFLNYLQMDTQSYLAKHLDKYTLSNRLDNQDVYSFMENAYAVYPEVKEIELLSYKNEKRTLFYSQGSIRVYHDSRERIWQMQTGQLCEDGEISYVKEIYNPNTLSNVGCLVITFDAGELQKIQGRYPQAELFVYHEVGENVIAPEGESFVLADFKSQEGIRKIDAYIEAQTVGSYEVVVKQNKSDASAIPLSMFFAILGIGFLLTFVGECIIRQYLKMLEGRLDKILGAMEQVTIGNLKVRLEEDQGGDELDMISANFNDMCQKLELYIQKSYLAEIEQKNAEMQALQSQINPHFLYNTLEAIRMKAIINGDREVAKMLYSMAVTFRSQIKEADVITVMQELHYCKKYLQLFEYRYKGKFTVDVQCEPELGSYPIIKFVLQPIVENYFIHGMRREDEDNEIRIWVEKQGERIRIHIEDNGCGMDKKSLDEKNKELKNNEMDNHKSIGIANVNRRIKAVYGESYGVTLQQRQPRGLDVIVEIKAEGNETDEESHAR